MLLLHNQSHLPHILIGKTSYVMMVLLKFHCLLITRTFYSRQMGTNNGSIIYMAMKTILSKHWLTIIQIIITILRAADTPWIYASQMAGDLQFSGDDRCQLAFVNIKRVFFVCMSKFETFERLCFYLWCGTVLDGVSNQVAPHTQNLPRCLVRLFCISVIFVELIFIHWRLHKILF